MALRIPIYSVIILLISTFFLKFTGVSPAHQTTVIYAQGNDNSIRGRVWEDLNNNGIQEAGEPDLPGITVNLSDLINNTQTTNTAADGSYAFDLLPPDTYNLQIIQPAGWTYVPQAQGVDSTLDSDVDSVTGREGIVIVNEGNHLVYDAGLYLMPTPTPTETAIPTETPTDTAIPTETPTPTATETLPAPPMFATDTPTTTPTATDMPIAIPTATLSPATFSCDVITEIALDECNALVTLYNSTDGPNWVNNDGWLTTHEPCQWHGVFCENGAMENSVVTVLDLGTNGLMGELPIELDGLDAVRELILDNNQLSGVLPDSMLNMVDLQMVILDYNAFSVESVELADILETIAPGWSTSQTTPPTGIQAIPQGPTELQLSWESAGFIEGVSYYEISYEIADTPGFMVVDTITDSAVTDYTVPMLEPDTDYNFRIRTITPPHGRQTEELQSNYSEIISGRTEQLLGCEIGIPAEGETCVDQSDTEIEIVLTEDDYLNIKLPVIPSNGSFWYIAGNDQGEDTNGHPVLRALEQISFDAPTSTIPVLGQAAIQIFRFDPLGPGQTTIKLEYRNVADEVIDTYTAFVSNEGTFDNVQPPSAPAQENNLPPLNPPPDESGGRARAMRSANALPTSFSWCDHPDGKDYCPPIQNQGTCGSCWAFTTVGAMETLINIKDGVERDLSEQHLLSCNSEDIGDGRRWSCANGGWYAFDYYTDKLSYPHNSGPGTVWELDFVYTGEDTACQAGLPHQERLSSWSYIDPSNPLSLSYVDDIKQAILDYGPVVTSLCVGPAAKEYRGGVFSTNESHLCQQYGVETNHAVLIVGWDNSEGTWVVRNSWDTWWGEEGYARIKYGTSNVGYAAAYAIYEGSTINGPAAPSSLTAEAAVTSEGYQINLNWQDESDDETAFQLFRNRGGNWLFNQELGAGETSYQDREVECNQEYSYRVKSVNGEGESGYSNTIKSMATCEDLQAPASFTAITSSSGIVLEWDNLNTLQDGVLVLRWNWEREEWEELIVLEGLVTRFEDTKELEPGQTYAYILRTVTDGRYSPPTEYQSAGAPTIRLSGPTGARAERVRDGEIKIAWDDNTEGEDGYIVVRYNAVQDSWEEVERLDSDVTEYIDNTLSCEEQKHFYQVVAFRGDTWSPFSNQASERPCADAEITAVVTTVSTNTPTSTSTPTAMMTAMPNCHCYCHCYCHSNSYAYGYIESNHNSYSDTDCHTHTNRPY